MSLLLLHCSQLVGIKSPEMIIRTSDRLPVGVCSGNGSRWFLFPLHHPASPAAAAATTAAKSVMSGTCCLVPSNIPQGPVGILDACLSRHAVNTMEVRRRWSFRFCADTRRQGPGFLSNIAEVAGDIQKVDRSLLSGPIKPEV